MAAELDRLTLEDLETSKAYLYHRLTGNAPTSDDLVERLVRMAGRRPRCSPQRGVLEQAILQMLDNRTSPLQGKTAGIVRSLAGAFYLPVCPRELLPSHQRNTPRAERVFDLLMARDAMQRDHPSRISSVLVHLASVIDLDAFETVGCKPLTRWYSHSSKQEHPDAQPSLDLSPLYGRGEAARSSLRQFRGGLIKTDCFASQQAARLPPGVGVLLVMFSRYHNYVATRLQA